MLSCLNSFLTTVLGSSSSLGPFLPATLRFLVGVSVESESEPAGVSRALGLRRRFEGVDGVLAGLGSPRFATASRQIFLLNC